MSGSESPSERIIAAANVATEITDSLGRKLKVRRLDALGSFDIMDALGGESSGNQVLLGYSNLAATVIEINGVPRPFPRDKKAIRASVAALGTEGLMAVSKFFSPDEDVEISGAP